MTQNGSIHPSSKNEDILEDNSDPIVQQLLSHPLVETSLRLSNKNISWLPKQLFKLSYIENLFLNNNNLITLPERLFEKLPMLKYLDLRSNGLVEIPSRGLESHKNLEVLLISFNEIEKLPYVLGDVKTLRNISWHDNPILIPENKILKNCEDTDQLKLILQELKLEHLEAEKKEGEEGVE